MTKISPKPKRKLTKYPRNLRITKTHPKPKKLPKYPLNIKKKKKKIEIPLKPKKLPKYPET